MHASSYSLFQRKKAYPSHFSGNLHGRIQLLDNYRQPAKRFPNACLFFCLAGYEERSKLKPLIWKAWAPQKCKFFAWLITKNRVWTSERLVTRGWPRNNVSPLCRREYKTTRHLLAACRYTKRVWSLIATWIAWPQLNPNCWQTTFSASDRGRMMATTAGVLQRRCDMYFNWLFEKSRRNTMQERSREKSYK